MKKDEEDFELQKIDINEIKLYPKMNEKIAGLLMIRNNDIVSMYAAKLIRYLLENSKGTPPHGSRVLTDHIKVCEKHPLRAAEATIVKLRSALAALVGVDGKRELEEMEAMIRMSETPDRDKAAAINAIHTLLETAHD